MKGGLTAKPVDNVMTNLMTSSLTLDYDISRNV